MKKNILKILVILCLFSITNIFASSLKIKMEFEPYFSSSFKGDIYRKSLESYLNFSFVENNSTLKLNLCNDYDTVKIVDKGLYVRELYFSQDFYFSSILDSINLKIGKIIYAWGNADELKPVDIINPQDYSYLLFKPLNERKYGVFSGNLNLYFSNNSYIEMIVIPDFEPNEIGNSLVFNPKQLSDLYSNPAITVMPTSLPPNKTNKINYAMRLGWSLFNIDMNLNFYYGFDHNPTVFTTLTSPTTMAVDFRYKRIEMWGFDFQRALFKGLGIRGEIAYYPFGKFFILSSEGMPSPFYMSLIQNQYGIVEKRYTEYTFGIDGNDFILKHLYFNLQLNGSHIFDYEDDLEQKENINYLMGTVEYSFLRELFRIKIRGFYDLTYKSTAIGGEISVKLSPNFNINSGFWNFNGDDSSYLGQYSENDFTYISAIIKFQK